MHPYTPNEIFYKIPWQTIQLLSRYFTLDLSIGPISAPTSRAPLAPTLVLLCALSVPAACHCANSACRIWTDTPTKHLKMLHKPLVNSLICLRATF